MDADNIPLKSVPPMFACRPSYGTVYRWATVGLLVNGRRVLLKAFFDGGRIYCSRGDVEQFKREINVKRFWRVERDKALA